MKRFLSIMALVALGCDTKPIEPAKKRAGSGPLQETEAASGGGDAAKKPVHNPAPVVDPTGSVQSYKSAKHEPGCENNLRQIATCLQVHVANRGDYPAAGKMLTEMVEAGSINDYRICLPPKVELSKERFLAGHKGAYETTKDALNDGTDANKPIAWDPEAWTDGRHVLTFGGSVSLMTEADFQKAWSKYEGGRK